MSRRWHWFVRGVRYRFPLCCILRFVFDNDGNAACRRGTIGPDSRFWVPCGIFHRVDICTICGLRRTDGQDRCGTCRTLLAHARAIAREEIQDARAV